MEAERQKAKPPPPKKRKKVKRVGTRVERIVSKMLGKLPGVRAWRVPGSGSFESLPHDVIAKVGDLELTHEVKARQKRMAKNLETLRAGSDVLVMWHLNNPDNARVYMDLTMYLRLVAALGEPE